MRIQLKLNDRLIDEIQTDEDTVTIGRDSENDVCIGNLAVSASHARVEKRGRSYRITDLGSTNGTFLAKKKIRAKVLREGDEVTIGKHTLVFRFGDGEYSTKSADQGKQAPDDGAYLDGTMALETAGQREFLQREAAAQLRKKGDGIGVLTVVEGATESSEHELVSPFTMIGKDPGAGIRLTGMLDPKVAGFVEFDKKGYALVPPEGGNKLKLNGKKVKGKTPLKVGDSIQIRGVSLRFDMRT